MDASLWISIAVMAGAATIALGLVLVAVSGTWGERPLRVVVAILAFITTIAFGGIYHEGELQTASLVGMALFGYFWLYSMGKLVK